MITPPLPPAIARPFDWEANIPDFLIHFIRLAGPFWNSENQRTIRLMTLGLVVLTVFQVFIAIEITVWSSNLFNALEQRSISKLWMQVLLALLILAANVSVTYYHLKIKRWIQLAWRGWLTDRLIGHWMDEGHHYQVAFMPGKHDNPDGRIAEDIRIATEFAIDLSHSLLYSLLLLFSFVKILWALSGLLALSPGLIQIHLPGYLVWLALLYAGAASAIGWWIARPMTAATDIRQTEEADFRFGLVRAREHSEAIALVRGEADERRRFAGLFQDVVNAWNQQTVALAHILRFTSGYSVISLVFPLLATAPRYILGNITLGALVQSAQSFQQVAAALSWPVDNMAKVAEWRASVERVLSLSQSLADLEEDVAHIDPHTVIVEDSQHEELVFSEVSIADPDGQVIVKDFSAKIRPGERVLLTGDIAAIDRLFKAVAGLWPWGRGRVELPAGDRMFFMPPRPYFPIDKLQAAVSYPSPPDAFEATVIARVLRYVGLEELIERLDETNTWERALTREAQQRLGLARLLLHRPNWILLQEALDSLDDENAQAMISLACETLPDAGILMVTRQPLAEALPKETLRIIDVQCSANGCVLRKETRIRRETDRRNRQPVGALRQLLGILRKDRRKSHSWVN